MKAIARILATMAAATLLSLVLGGVAFAASPVPTVGGTLSAAGNSITVLSNGNVTAHVVMAAEYVTLSETAFDLAPGQSHELTFTGKATGYVSATYTIVATGTETASATLSLNLVPRPVVAPLSLGDFGPGGRGAPVWIIVLILAVALILRRVKPWQWRLTRVA